MNPIHDPLAVGDLHLTLPTGDLESSTRLYDLLLGPGEGSRWAAVNGSVALTDTAGPNAAGTGEAGTDEEGPTVALAVADLAESAALLGRRGLALREQSGGVALADFPPMQITAAGAPRPSERRIDHLVLTVADADRAIALFGGRLGINLRLARDIGDGVSQLFFRTRSAVLEVVAGAPDAGPGIDVMGVAWRCADIVGEQRRLVDAGLNVSDVRTGRKAGTRVCTVREPDLGTATLLIQQ